MPALLRYASNWLHRYLCPPNYRRIRLSQGTPFIPKRAGQGCIQILGYLKTTHSRSFMIVSTSKFAYLALGTTYVP